MTCWRWTWTVCSLMPSSRATSLLAWPRARRAGDFLFTGGELGQAVPGFLVAAAGGVAFQAQLHGPFHGVEEELVLEGLLQEIHGAVFHGLDGQFHVAVAGHEDDGVGGVGGLEAALQFQAADPGAYGYPAPGSRLPGGRRGRRRGRLRRIRGPTACQPTDSSRKSRERRKGASSSTTWMTGGWAGAVMVAGSRRARPGEGKSAGPGRGQYRGLRR